MKIGKLPVNIVAGILILIVNVVMIGGLVYSSQLRSQDVRTSVSRLLDIDSGDAKVSKIQDVSKLVGFPFYKDAIDNDYLVYFQDEQKAVLYRPATDKIVNFTTLTGELEENVLGAFESNEPEEDETEEDIPLELKKIAGTDDDSGIDVAFYNDNESDDLTDLYIRQLQRKTDLEYDFYVVTGLQLARNSSAIINLNDELESEFELISNVLGVNEGSRDNISQDIQADILITIGSPR